MKPLYSDSELVTMAQNCETILELIKIAETLKYLYEDHGQNISLHGFRLLTHLRVRQLINTPNSNKI
jgi:hypothetical protein